MKLEELSDAEKKAFSRVMQALKEAVQNVGIEDASNYEVISGEDRKRPPLLKIETDNSILLQFRVENDVGALVGTFNPMLAAMYMFALAEVVLSEPNADKLYQIENDQEREEVAYFHVRMALERMLYMLTAEMDEAVDQLVKSAVIQQMSFIDRWLGLPPESRLASTQLIGNVDRYFKKRKSRYIGARRGRPPEDKTYAISNGREEKRAELESRVLQIMGGLKNKGITALKVANLLPECKGKGNLHPDRIMRRLLKEHGLSYRELKKQIEKDK